MSNKPRKITMYEFEFWLIIFGVVAVSMIAGSFLEAMIR